ncbi:hypothetical protein FA95DRAFT_1557222 [Auriscalpium vulgare]|uniref:Uncharacterized protein n=1 Tax=Auriscalpium vulgare TaxID=40419 RepID=A0ACB8RZT2_9AGAM|nr:hypothetical protein FA95DRAFT_1557222 [Auriscalpium vulgare]
MAAESSSNRIVIAGLARQCENCAKHLPDFHPSKVKCDSCLPKDTILRRCRNCKKPFYCTRECQRANWPKHKMTCYRIEDDPNRTFSDAVMERSRAFDKWCKRNDPHIIRAGVSAMEVRNNRAKLDTHVFIVYIDTVKHPPSAGATTPTYTHTIRKAVCEELSHVHAKYDRFFASRTSSGFDVVEQSLATRPGTMRTLVIDDGLPISLGLYTMPTEIRSFSLYESDWLALLISSVTS